MKLTTLFISFYFPPFSRVGGRRWAKHIKYFQQFGEKFKVLAGDFEGKSPWDNDVKSYESEITRIPISVYYPYYKRVIPKNFIQKLKWKISLKYNDFLEKKYPGNFWDDSRSYENQFYSHALAIIKREKINHVCLSIGPFAYASILPKLKKEIEGLKITIDYRDYWHDSISSLSESKKSEEIRKQQEVLNSVDLILAPNSEMCTYFENEFKKNTYLLPHSFDESDLLGLSNSSSPKINSIKMVYGGTFYEGISSNLNTLNDLLNKLENIVEVDVSFYAPLKGYEKELTNKNIKRFGFIESTQYFEKVLESDYAILILAEDHRVNAMTSKFFELVALRKAILCFGRDGLVTEFIIKNNLGFHVTNFNIDLVYKLILKNLSTQEIPNKDFDIRKHTFENNTIELIKFWNKYYGVEN